MDNRYPRTPLPPPPTRPSQGSVPSVPSHRPATLLSPAPVTPGYAPPGAANPHFGYAPTGYGPPAPMPHNAYGHGQSRPSSAHPTASSAYGSLPPLGWQGTPPSMGPPKSGPPAALVAAGAAAAGVALLAVIAGAWAMFHTSHKPLPVAAAKLPTDTDFFQEDRFPGADGPPAVRDAFLTSDLARHVCGAGSDFAERLMRLKSGGARSPDDALTLFDPKTIEGRRASLQCGQSLLGALANPSFTELVFHDGDDKKFLSVEMLRLNVEELPAKFGFAKHTFSGIGGYCLANPKKTEPVLKWSGSAASSGKDNRDSKEGECGEDSLAAFHEGPTWFFGKKNAIDAFARSYSKPKKELSTTVENLQLAFDSGEGLAVRRADARAKASSALLKLPCSVAAFDSGAGSKFVEECMPKSVEKNASSIASNGHRYESPSNPITSCMRRAELRMR